MSDDKVAILGAGPCGLAAAKVLADYGFDYDCLEAGDAVGGIWNIERGGGGYRSLYANTSVGVMRYSDFPFPEGTDTFPTAPRMVDYFNDYADHNGLRSRIQFSCRVERVSPAPEGGWHLMLAGGEQRRYRAVIVATGQYAAPRLPHEATPGDFEGDHLHVVDYLDPATPVALAGKRVLVVGLGTSAAEVAAELSRAKDSEGRATRVMVAARSGRWVIPKDFASGAGSRPPPHPADPLPGFMRWLPGWARVRLMRRVMGGMIRGQFEQLGGAAALGLPEPSRAPWEERPTLSTEMVQALQDKLLDIRPGIERFEGRRVIFTDGSEAEADAIVYGTGYERDFPYLDPAVMGGPGRDIALYQRIMPPEQEGLFILGCLPVMCALWPLAEQQSHWVARLLRGDFKLPSKGSRRRQAVILREALPVMCNAYIEDLRKQAGGF